MTLDEAFVKALVEDYEHAPLTPQDRVMLDYVGDAHAGRDRASRRRTTSGCARRASTTAASCRSR